MAPAFLCAELLSEKLQSLKALEREMCGNGPKTECESPVLLGHLRHISKVATIMVVNDNNSK